MNRSVAAGLVCVFACLVAGAKAADFSPDPASVQRDGPAYRYPQAGWIVVHVEGKPYERGQQQGKLLWREIQNYAKCFAVQQSSSAPGEGWQMMRTMTDAMFVRRFDPELLEEMKGIADGAAKAGAKFDGRPLDLTDIVAINAWPEVMSLQDALGALPTGLEGRDYDKLSQTPKVSTAPSRCSAFAATGPATRDGKAMIGHITMFDLYPCDFFNIWLDVKPETGHRVVFQAAPGSVQSGMDWYENDAGMVLTETTIGQTKFNPSGLSIGSRSRRSMQYGDNVESVVKLLGENGNGLYTNEWLLADMKTNEIALYELGTETSRLMRSSKNEWFGGTEGFYWGNNNTKDLAVRMETIAATNDRPADMTFCPEPRDQAWIKLYKQYKGQMDASFAQIAFNKPPLISRHSCDAKFVTADMALQMKSFAHWGDPYGQLWEPSNEMLRNSPEATAIVPNDWTIMTTAAPATQPSRDAAAVDLGEEDGGGADDEGHHRHSEGTVAWHGTILPATDGDIWLASAFANYHDVVSAERQFLKDKESDDQDDMEKTKGKEKPAEADAGNPLSPSECDKLAVKMFAFRESALSEGLARQSVALGSIKSDPSDDMWYRTANGRGVLLLSALRNRIGAAKFDAAMDAFGRSHAGERVTSQEFIAAMSKANGSDLKDFFAHWLDGSDALPTLELTSVTTSEKDGKHAISGIVLSHAGCTPTKIEITVETEDGEKTTAVPFKGDIAEFHITGDDKPVRVVINKYNQTPMMNGCIWSCSDFMRDLEHTVIVYGTRAESAANRIAAEKLQSAIIGTWQHLSAPIKADNTVSDDDLRGHHVLLIGRPECSELIDRLSHSLPVTFGRESVTVRGKLYANADTAVDAAGVNPMDSKYSIVCVAGMSPAATLRAAKWLPGEVHAPVRVLAANQGAKDIVPPATELVHEFK